MRWSYCSQIQRLEQRFERRQQLEQRLAIGERRENRARIDDGKLGRLDMGPIVERGLIAKLLDRQIGLDLTLVLDDETQRVRGLAHNREIEAPFAEDRLGLLLLLRAQHHQHALLTLGEQHFIGRHAFLAAGDSVEVELDPQIALGAHFDGRRSEAGGAHVLNGDDRARLHQLETGLEQELLGEGIADLHGRALLLGVGLEGGGSHGRAVNAVAPRLGAQIDDRIAHARRGRIEDRIGAREADRHRIDEDVAVIGRIELGRAADRRHAEGIAIAADPGDDAGEQRPGLGVVRRAEAQEIEAGDGPRAHRENVAQDAAHARRRALIGLDEGGVVVALHLEDDRVAVADVDHPGVFARSPNHPGRRSGKLAQMQARGLVGAVLVPHRGEDAELREARRAAEQRQNALIFLGFEAMSGDERRVDPGFCRRQSGAFP